MYNNIIVLSKQFDMYLFLYADPGRTAYRKFGKRGHSAV